MLKFSKNIKFIFKPQILIWGFFIAITIDYSIAQDKSDSFQQHILKKESKVFSALLTDSLGAGSIDVLLSCFDTSGVQIWSKTYGGTSVDLVNGLFLKDSLLFVYGRTKSSNIGSDDYYIMALDQQGNFIDEIIFGTTSLDKAKNLVYHEGYFYFLGTSVINTIISKISFDLNSFEIENSIIINSNFNQYAEMLLTNESNEIIVAGNLDTLSGAQKDFFYFKFDSEFNVIYSKSYGDNVSQEISYGDLDLNGNLYLAGNTETSGSKNALIVKLDSVGNLITNKSFGTFLNEKAYELKISKSEVFIGGYTQSTTGSYDDAFIVKMNDSLNFLNKSRLDLQNDEYLTKIDFENGKTLLSGPYKKFGSPEWNYFSIDLDSNFMSCNLVDWSLDSFTSVFSQSDVSISVDSIDLIIETASLTLETQNIQFEPLFCNIIIISEDPIDDSIKDSIIGGINTKELNVFNIFPNPTKNFVSISSESQIKSISIFNSLGENVFYIDYDSRNQIQLDLSIFESGLYFVVSKTKKGSYQNKIILN